VEHITKLIVDFQELIEGATAACIIIGAILKIMGNKKAARAVAELLTALQEAAHLIAPAVQDGKPVNERGIATAVAAEVRGMHVDDVKPIVAALAAGTTASHKGIELSLGEDGKLRVDTTGFAVRKARKMGKFLKKVF
jgi:hypothetical protein